MALYNLAFEKTECYNNIRGDNATPHLSDCVRVTLGRSFVNILTL